MTTRASVSRLLIGLLLGASLLGGCGKQDSAALVAEAKTLQARGDTQGAMIQLKNAVAQDDRHAEARYQLGKLYLDQGNLAGAEKELRRAREAGYAAGAVNPLIARAMLGQREFQRLLDEIPAPTGNDNDAAILNALRATAELALGQKESARKTMRQAIDAAPGAPEVHLAWVSMALADGDSDGAMQAIDRALAIDTDNREALLLKGDLQRALGKPTQADATYRQLVKVDPRNMHARVALASLALADNKPASARREIDAALKIAPNNLLARYTQALIDFREQKVEAARDHLAAVLKSAPEYGPALLLGGAIEYSLGNLQTAETHLNKVVKIAPGNLYALRLLAATQLRLGRVEQASSTLAPALRAQGDDPGVLVVAGEIALAKRDYASASAYFEKAAQQKPGSPAIRAELGVSRLAQGDSRAMADLQAAAGMEGASNRADNFIILTQLRKKEFDAALASIAALEKKDAVTPLTLNYRGAAHLGKNDVKRARESFAQALRVEPAFFPAAANLAQLDIKDKQPDAARQRFEGVLRADPKHLNAMLALADLALLAKDEKTHVSWLEKAASVHTHALQPRVLLARHQLTKGDKNKALATAREAVNVQPDNPAALELLGNAQLALGDTTNALASYRKMVDKAPGQAAPLAKLATVQILAKDVTGARKSLEDALRIQPDFIDAQLILGSLDIQAGQYDAAKKRAKQIQQQHPDSAAGFILDGDIALARQDHAAALAAYDRAFKLQPSGALLVKQLGSFDATGRGAEAEKRLLNWLASHPKDTNTRAALAEHLITRRQYKAAADQYFHLNRDAPGNLLVLNNLAWALQASGDQRALEYAEQALKLKPDDPAVLDTLGWILVQQGKADRGIKLLQDALSKAPDAAEIHYHLASAYARKGDHARARDELQRLFNSGAAFPQEQEARTLLRQLDDKVR